MNLAVDPKGRLIASDQYGKLWRVTPPPVGATGQGPKVEAIPVELGEAQGLLWAFDSLYVVVNAQVMAKSGLYRVKDTDGDDVLDKVELLRKLDGNSEHGPHAVVLSPDGKSLYVVAGNATKLTELAGSLVPRVWGEDQLLPNMPDGRGFMRDEKAPGGWIARTDSRWQELGTGLDGLPQLVRYGVQPLGRPLHVRLRHGVGHEHPLVSPDPDLPRRQRR